jgi:adenylate cyclase
VIGTVAWQIVERLGAPSRENSSVALEAQRRGPIIAVLPFDNLSGDPSQDFFSDGISEQLITVLSHFGNLRVLARNTTFAYKKKATDAQELGRQLNVQYVIEGSFRRVADQISVTAQLIDARTGTHVWAQTFERPTASASLLAIQDDVAQRISAAVGDMRMGAVTKAELERTRNKPATDLSSYECSLVAKQAGGLLQSVELVQRARTCLEATMLRDPTYAEAWADLVNILFDQRVSGIGLPSPEAEDIDKRAYLVPRMMDTAKRAVGLSPQCLRAHLALFFAYWAACQPERMRVEAETIQAINPNDIEGLLTGYGLILAGDAEYGCQLAQKGLALAGPTAPPFFWGAIGGYYTRKGEWAESLEYYRKAYTDSWVDHMRLIIVLSHLGRIDEARAEIPAALKLRPDISVHEYNRWVRMFCINDDWRQRIATGLRLAGMREEADENRAPQSDAATPNKH